MDSKVMYLTEVPVPDGSQLFASEPDVMTVSHVSKLLDVAESTLRREIARGRLETVHIGSCVRVTKTALLRYIREEKQL